MKVQNLTGNTTIVRLGRNSTEMAAGAIWTIPDKLVTDEVFRDARHYEDEGLIAIIEGPDVHHVLGSRTLPANGTITFAGVGTEDDTIVIGTRTYGLSADSSYPSGSVGVDIGGTAAETAEALADAINADSGQTLVKAVQVGAVVYLAHKTNGKVGSGVDLDASGCDDATASGATLDDGVYGSALDAVIATVTADGNDVVLNTGLTAISHVIVQCRDSAGLLKDLTGQAVTITDGVVIVAAGAAIANTDLVTFIVFG